MVKFIEIDPNEIGEASFTHRGRVSYPILKNFLETGFYVVKIDRTGMQQSAAALQSSLRAYALNHEMPVKVFSRVGEVYLMRLDVDKDGNKIPGWKKMLKGPLSEDDPIPVTRKEVAKRYGEEKDKTTK